MPLRFRLVLGFALATLLVVRPSPAEAQSQAMDLQIFQPTAGVGTTFRIDRTEVLRHRTYVLGFFTNFGGGLLERRGAGGDQQIVPWRFQNELAFSIGLFEWMQLGVVVPLSIERVASDPLAQTLSHTTVVGMSDPRLSVKVPIVRGRFSLSAELLMSMPASRGKHFLGSDRWTATPSLIAAYRLGPVTVTGQLGYAFRKRAVIGNLEWDDELQIAAGAAWTITEKVSLLGELASHVGLGGRTIAWNQAPMELDVGVRVQATKHIAVDVGGGTGVISGYGSPLYRAFAMVRYTNEDEPCAAGPEDYDGFEDGDFCKDPDNDGDHILDGEDACPNDAETFDEFEDADGCPDSDDDADGLVDEVDRCPRVSEDLDEYQDDDGCPEPDNDDDGVLDGVDSCPMEPEDRDAYQDEDGCPEPGPNRVVITVTDSRILISERVYFDFDTDVIRSVSFPLLDQVAEVVRELPANRRVRVDGYSDSEGDDNYNAELSYRRARAVVEYLVQRGVAADRLSYAGYGELNPVAPNDSIDGRALNRRVEFTILNPDDSPNVRPGGARPAGRLRRRR